jgi:V/A-type H+-transporting ATPase subunit E
MEAQQVTEKILSDAQAEADKIKSQAQEKQAAEQKKLDEQLDDYKKQTKVLAEKAAEDEKSHIIAAQRMALAKQLLDEKRKILDEVFESALRQLQKLPDDQYEKLIIKLLLESVETGDEEVIVGKNETRIDQQLINRVNEQLNPDKKGSLKLSGERQDIEGGFILRRNKIKTNVTFDVLLSNARKKLEIELAKELFGG